MKLLKAISVIVLFCLFAYFGYYDISNNKLEHTYPIGYLASDAFQHQTRAEGLKDLGNYRYEAFYNMAGYSDVVGFYSPLLYHFTIIFSDLTNLPIYDSILILVHLFVFISVCFLFLWLWEFDETLALFSIPLTFFILNSQLRFAFYWGHWPSLVGLAFVVPALYCLSDIKKYWIYFGLLFAGVILIHTPESIMLFLFTLMYLIIKLLLKRLKFEEFKYISYSGIIAFILSAWYLIIFAGTWLGESENAIVTYWGNPMFGLLNFDYLLPLIIIGVGLSFLYYYKTDKLIFLLPLFSLIVGFGNYFGLSWRAFQFRFFWPVFLSIAVGSVFYFAYNQWIKDKKYIVYIISALFIFSVLYVYTDRMQPQSIVSQDQWNAFIWMQGNIPKEDNILFLYGDGYWQDAVLRNSKHTQYVVEKEDYINSYKDVKKEYMIKIPSDAGTRHPYRKSFFTFGKHYYDDGGEDWRMKERAICSFDYIVGDVRANYIPELVYSNVALFESLSNSSVIAYQNNQVVVLKNNKGECR